MKCATDRLYSAPEKAARRLMEHAHFFEPIQDGRIYIEKINGPFLFGDKGTPAEYAAGLELAIKRGWLELRIRNVCEVHRRRRRSVRLMADNAPRTPYKQRDEFGSPLL